jgi:two-component system cell cycle sensor histidine kinase/response regulator CckA
MNIEIFRDLIENSIVGFYIFIDYIFVYVNPELVKIFGYDSKDEIIGKTVFDLTAEEYHEIVRDNIKKRIDGEIKGLRYTFKGKRKDNSIIDVEVYGSLINIDGRPAIVGTLIDITEKKKLEEEKEKTRLFLESVLNNINDFVMVIAPDYTVRLINKPLRKLSFENTYCYHIAHNLDRPCEEYPCPLKTVIETKRPIQCTHKHPTKDSSNLIMEIIASPIFDENGDVIYVIELMRDITKRVMLEEEHKAMMRILFDQDKDRSMMTVVGGIAHEFNNILMGILGSAEILRIKAQQEEIHLIDNIINSSHRMAESIKQMLAYIGYRQGRANNININDIIIKVIESIKEIKNKNIDLTIELSDDLFFIFADSEQIKQMLINLIKNSIEAMDIGGKLFIRTENESIVSPFKCQLLKSELPEGDYVKLTVKDTGHGIPPELIPKVFEPFFTTRFIGRGLGLSAVSGIVKRHKGCIDLQSTLGKGTEITILLPKSEIEEIEKPIKKETFTGKTILAVDDEEAILLLLKKALTYSGYKVFLADSGSKAIELFEQHKDLIDSAIIDIDMPDINGKELIKKLKESSKDLKIIVSSGYDKSIATSGIDSLIDGFLQKPYQLKILFETLKKLES